MCHVSNLCLLPHALNAWLIAFIVPPVCISKRSEKFVGEYFYINLPFVTLLYGFFQLLWVFLWAINMNYPQLAWAVNCLGAANPIQLCSQSITSSSHYNHSLPACICKLTLSPWQWLAKQSISVQANRLLTFNIEQQCASYGNNKPNHARVTFTALYCNNFLFYFCYEFRSSKTAGARYHIG